MPQQKLFTAEVLARLAANGKATRDAQRQGLAEPDHRPVVKIFNPYGPATWLLSESEPSDSDTLFGLCDLGQGAPELGYVSRGELESIRIGGRLPLERDAWFKPEHTIGEYAKRARAAQRIVA